ncbi:MAG: chorismate mutase [Lachnospiraceae bacterium]|nr:chorismate mutase [Lachnospiraceae bacterium]
MRELENARKEINRIDREMLKLFEERMSYSKRIGEFKKENALAVRDKERERELISNNRGDVENKEIEGYYVDFLKKLLDISCDYQSRIIEGIRIAYCGVEGAFSYIAAKKLFPEGGLHPFGTFFEAYRAVERGDMDAAILPIENSFAGDVGTVMDLMFSGSLYINQVVSIDVIQNLMSVEGASLDTIKTVISHPQALEQCEEFIEKHGFERVTYSNTALAAKYVKEKNDPTVAAIASAETAELYGLKMLEQNINTSKNNTTRFAVFTRTQNTPLITGKHDNERFILVYTVQNEAGSLAQTLNLIGAHGYNMISLRSRPMKDLMWTYYFYVEAEGNVNNQNGKDMLRELSALCANLKLVGSYLDS